MSVEITRVITTGDFTLDGQSWVVDNNVWIIGDEKEVYIIDAAHNAMPILKQIQGRKVKGIICTHAHNDHVTVAPELSQKLDAPIYVHPGDDMLWQMVHPEVKYVSLDKYPLLNIAGADLKIISTPGHSPGSIAIYAPEAGVLFSGDTLFEGGPGATGRSFSDFPTIIDSIRNNILILPAETLVYTGHGDQTSVAQEAPHLEEWIARGH